jgi:prepilin-type N-terminal cleavage/methylation domain-containing protein/prepilin-type processing-associated H-X9-DG protein
MQNADLSAGLPALRVAGRVVERRMPFDRLRPSALRLRLEEAVSNVERQNAEQECNGKARAPQSRRSFRRARSALCILHLPALRVAGSAFCVRAFTLLEMLVVIGIIGMLAGLLASAVLYAHNLSIRTECQQNLNHIGQTVSMLVLSNNGLFPIGPPLSSSNTIAPLSNAYPRPQVTTPGGTTSNDFGFPWWARVFEQWEGDMGLLYAKNPNGTYFTDNGQVDANFNPNGFVLNAQLPPTMNGLRCRAGGALDGSSVANLFNSISYGINFDVKDAGIPNNTPPVPPREYCTWTTWSHSLAYNPGNVVLYNDVVYTCLLANTNSAPGQSNPDWQPTNYCPNFPNNLSTADMCPDQYRATEIQNPGAFILIAEASTQSYQSLTQPNLLPPQLLQQLPAWSAPAQYSVGDIVSFNGVVYTCTAPNSGSQPPASPNCWKPGYWTGGRISTAAISRGNSNSNPPSYPPSNAPIVGRHSGYANVLFADYHVEAVEIVPGQTTANMNINYNTPLWTLPGK